MNEFEKTWAVNWQDGMLISEKHLNEAQRYTDDLTRRAVASVTQEYGLVPDDRLNPSPEIILDWQAEMVGSNAVQVQVMSCRALAPDGSLIAVFRQAYDYGMKYVDVKEITDPSKHRYSIFISAKENRFMAIGGNEDEAGRLAYKIPDYAVTISGADSSKQNALKIGQIIVANGEVSVDDRYIPPCTSMSCHKRLTEFAKEFHTALRDLLSLSAECFRRLSNKMAPQGIFSLTDPEAAILLIFSRHMAQRISDTFDDFRDEVSRSSPRRVVIFFKSLFRNVTLSLQLAADNAQQTLFSLWMHHIDSTFVPADFERAMDRLHKMPYSHEHIAPFMGYVFYLLNQFIRFFRILLSKVWSAQVTEPKPEPPRPQPAPPPEPPKPKPKPKPKPQPIDDFRLLDVEKDDSEPDWI